MPLFGIDVSHHQGAGLDFSALRRAGVEFAFIKSSEGDSFTDPQFEANLDRARKAGMLVAAYHYVRAGATAALQAGRVSRVVPPDVPVIPDVESGSGNVSMVRAFVSELRRFGYTVPLLYLPRWYWQQIGSPPLDGLPPLWSSRYPDNVAGTIDREYAGVPSTYWNGYGGLGVAVLQFTSSAEIAGRGPFDANAFKGTREELSARLGGDGEDDMQPSDLVINPATGQPALDINGNPYSYNQAWYYDNLNSWEIRNQGSRIESQLATLAASITNGELDPDDLTARLETAAREAASQAVERAIGAVVVPALRDVLADVLSDDNSDVAAQIVEKLGEKLRAAPVSPAPVTP